MTTRHICCVPGCPDFTEPGKSRCDEHEAEQQQRRGTTTQQGLGWQHQQHRRRLIQAALGTWCPDCPPDRPTLMIDPKQMVADHSTQDRTQPADRVHCRPCSDSQGGKLSHQVGGTPLHRTRP